MTTTRTGVPVKPGVSILTRNGATRSGRLGVPSDLFPALVAAGLEGARFRCELTDEGILFRPLGDDDWTPTVDLPAWAKNGAKR